VVLKVCVPSLWVGVGCFRLVFTALFSFWIDLIEEEKGLRQWTPNLLRRNIGLCHHLWREE
jgi:hypothetical protein